MTRFIFITGGVVSSLGKGITASALGALLQARGFKIAIRKLDPYLNVDPGTMSPYEHGEVFVTEDGAETDLDLGHYERFTGIPAKRGDSTTTGQIYFNLISKERKGEYLGATVQVIPHVTDLIKDFILAESQDLDFVICEIGGTVGDIESQPYIEAIRQLSYNLGLSNVMYIHVTLLPFLEAAGELKTKPTQHSVKDLRSMGIQPNLLICRTNSVINEGDKRKIGLFCNVPQTFVIEARDQKSIYQVPIAYHGEGLDSKVMEFFNLSRAPDPDLSKWKKLVNDIKTPSKSTKIAVIGKYANFRDAYKSLIEAFAHAGLYLDCKVELLWFDSENIQNDSVHNLLTGINGIIIPGGFGIRGIEGKLEAIKYARENNIPFFGICLGMQLALIEFAKNILHIDDATSREFNSNGTAIIELLTVNSKKGYNCDYNYNSVDIGGTMRLGSFECQLVPGSKAYKVYKNHSPNKVLERHRHRFCFNKKYTELFERNGMKISGISIDGNIAEVIESDNNEWYLGVQFHPEFKSNPFAPHPLFVSFVNSAINYSSKQYGK